MYKLANSGVGYVKVSDGSWVGPNNQEIQEWLAQGNTPLPYTPPPAPVPQQCTQRQGQKALLRTPYGGGGNMLDAVKALIAAIPDDFERADAEIDFNAAVWERSNPTLQTMWAQLGGTQQQLDELFTLASTL